MEQRTPEERCNAEKMQCTEVQGVPTSPGCLFLHANHVGANLYPKHHCFVGSAALSLLARQLYFPFAFSHRLDANSPFFYELLITRLKLGTGLFVADVQMKQYTLTNQFEWKVMKAYQYALFIIAVDVSSSPLMCHHRCYVRDDKVEHSA